MMKQAWFSNTNRHERCHGEFHPALKNNFERVKRFFSNQGFILSIAIALTGLSTARVGSQDLATALLLTKSENYDKAGEMLQQLIRNEPANSKYYFFLGENVLLDYYADTISNSLALATTSARDIFQKGVTANPQDPLNYIGLAKVASYLDDEESAREMRSKAQNLLLPYKSIKKMIPPAKDYAYALAKIAESYIRNKEVDTSMALPLIRHALKIDSKNAEIYLIAGDIYILMNDGTKAIYNYNMANIVDPKSPTSYMKIGKIYMRGRNLQAAIPKFEDAIAIDANYAPAYRELGQLYWMAQRLDQSKANYKKYLDLNVGNIPAQTRYVTSLFYAGDYDEVIKNVEEILAVDKSRSFLNRLAGYSYYEKKNADYDKALYYMDELFKTVSQERILWKDHAYAARIIMKKNQDYLKKADDLQRAEQQLQKDKARYSAALASEKARLKPALDELTAKTDNLRVNLAKMNSELDKGFQEYDKVIGMMNKLQDMIIYLKEMAGQCLAYKRYNLQAKTLARLVDPGKEDLELYMRISRAFYSAENFKAADSVLNIILNKTPNFLPAHVQLARTSVKIDPDDKTGSTRQKFEKVINLAQCDSVKNASDMMEALVYLGYYHMSKKNFSTSKSYYSRLINLDPNNKEYRIRGYNGLGNLESEMAQAEKTNEGKLVYLGRSAEAYQKIIAIDPQYAPAKRSLEWVNDYIALVKQGINPNEIKGTVTDAATGKPVAYVSIRVKDTAAETITSTKGTYKFEIPQGSEILLVTAKGYQTQEIPVNKSRIYNIKLSK